MICPTYFSKISLIYFSKLCPISFSKHEPQLLISQHTHTFYIRVFFTHAYSKDGVLMILFADSAWDTGQFGAQLWPPTVGYPSRSLSLPFCSRLICSILCKDFHRVLFLPEL